MTDKRPRRPSLFALVALALVLACLTVSGALAKGRTHVLTGEGVYIHPGGFVDVTPGDVVTADSIVPPARTSSPVAMTSGARSR